MMTILRVQRRIVTRIVVSNDSILTFTYSFNQLTMNKAGEGREEPPSIIPELVLIVTKKETATTFIKKM